MVAELSINAARRAPQVSNPLSIAAMSRRREMNRLNLGLPLIDTRGGVEREYRRGVMRELGVYSRTEMYYLRDQRPIVNGTTEQHN